MIGSTFLKWTILASLLFQYISFVEANSCSVFNSNVGASYDLTDLIRSPEEPSYRVEDGDIPCTTNVVEKNYTYIFNICGTIGGPSIPSACNKVSGLTQAGAVQINTQNTAQTSDDWCYLAGTYSDSTSALTLIDQEDPTKGVQLVYYGTICSSTLKPRKFVLQFSCAEKMSAVPIHALEYEPCVYTVEIPSIYGCPTECPVANRKICGGNGHCSYDGDKLAAKCFCNKGFYGSDCTSTSTSSSESYSPALLGLIITLFVIVVLLAGSIVYMVKQMNAYKQDLAHYQVLKGSEEDSAIV